MQKLHSTKIDRFIILQNNEEYFLMDLFSKKVALLLPGIGMVLSRRAYTISEKEILKDLIETKEKKSI